MIKSLELPLPPSSGAVCSECGVNLTCISCKKPLYWSSELGNASDLCVKHSLNWLNFFNADDEASNEIRQHIVKYHCCSERCEELADIFEVLDVE